LNKSKRIFFLNYFIFQLRANELKWRVLKHARKEMSIKKWPISWPAYNDSAYERTAHAFLVIALSRIYYSARSSKKPMISSRTCAFCATARANSSSGAGSSGVILVPPAAPPPPTVLQRGLTGPPVEYGQLPTKFPPPMDSRFPEKEKIYITL